MAQSLATHKLRDINHLAVYVMQSGARNLALSISNAMRDSSSPTAPRNDVQTSVVSHLILDNPAHCEGGADIEVNVCATPGAIVKS